MAYMQDEFSYDNFHPDVENKYVMALDASIGDSETYQTSTPPPLAPTMQQEIPQVKQTTRVHHTGDLSFEHQNNAFTEDGAYWADSNFFSFFGYKLLEGDPQTVLNSPNKVVITQKIAQKYFGNTNPIGKTLLVGNEAKAYTVSGVSANPRSNTHLQYEILLPFKSSEYYESDNWFGNRLHTYVQLKSGSDLGALQDNIRNMVVKNIGPVVEEVFGKSLEQVAADGGKVGYETVSIQNLRLNAFLSQNFGSPISIIYIYIFSAFGILLLLIACFNFMNLSTARASARAKEVGLRKTLGSQRGGMIIQFLLESTVYVFFAIMLSLVMVYFSLPWFNQLAGKSITFGTFFDLQSILSLLGLLILLGLFAGSYPAFYLTKFKPTDVLKGEVRKGAKSGGFRRTLVVSQFFISIALISCTLLVNEQLQYMQNKDLGINKENTMVLKNTSRLGESQATFRESLMQLTDIKAASYASHSIPGYDLSTFMRPRGAEEDQVIPMYRADWYQDDVLGFELKEGRYFNRDFKTDSAAVVINEEAAKAFNMKDPIGKQIDYQDDNYEIIGIMENFNFQSVQNDIEPLVIFFSQTSNEMLVHFQSDSPQEALTQIEATWEKYAGGVPLEYSFLETDFNQQFEQERRLSQVFTVLTIIAIIITCLGLIGLSAYMTEQRTQEIGVRKVLGASTKSIVSLLSKEFLKLTALAFALAMPVAWFVINTWLQNFAYRIEVGPKLFILTGIITILVVLLSISWQTLKAATMNPVKSIRTE